MGRRENKVETYLDEQVEEKLGGITRKWESPGHDGVPERLVLTLKREILAVEVKTIDGVLSPEQKREHDRLRSYGLMVTTVYGHNGVDTFIDEVLNNKHPLAREYH